MMKGSNLHGIHIIHIDLYGIFVGFITNNWDVKCGFIWIYNQFICDLYMIYMNLYRIYMDSESFRTNLYGICI